jgi:tetratricopeptide (TPR) repeat protein
MTSENHLSPIRLLHNLRIKLSSSYSRTGSVPDLEESIQLARQIVNMTPERYPDRAEKLNGLANRLGDRYLRLGLIADLDESIQLARQAVDAAPEGYPNRGMYLNDLAVSLNDRYMRTGAMAALEEAIQTTARAVDMTPENHPQWAMYLSNLGCFLDNKYSRTHAIADLEEAIRLGRGSIDATEPSNNLDRAGRLNNLGLRLRHRYLRTGAVPDLEEAIRLARWALDLTPENHPDRMARLSSLGSGLKHRYLRAGAISDLEEAIQAMREAVNLAPADHPKRADLLQELGSGLVKRAKKTRDKADFEEAVIHLQSALRQSNASAITRIKAGHAVFLASTINADWKHAEEASKISLNLVPQLMAPSLENSDKQHVLRQIVGLAPDAAAVALKANKSALVALTYLEQGRGVLAASLEDMRADIGDLRERHPELAERFIHVREELAQPAMNNAAFPDQERAPSWQDQLSQRYDAGNKFDDLIIQIRKQPGFADFLTAPNAPEMQAAARAGPIVVINVSGRRCDAILVEEDQIRALPLPQLSVGEIRRKIQESSLGNPVVLEWLWDVAASPVLIALGFTQPPSGDNWPHIWWIPTGPLNKFPLHAAGRHRNNCTETVLDRVISSYSTSIKSIIHGRRRNIAPSGPAPVQALLVAMQDTPGHSRLHFAAEEIAMVHDLCASMGLDPIDSRRRKQDVISYLPNCKIFHFAGHGYTDTRDPSKSSLLLDDWKSEPLTVATLLETNLRKGSPFLAYLSACGTGQIKDDKSIDESIHLISGCQLAGFRHVIGTLWEVNDESCVDVSRVIYEEIRNEGMTDESVCRGLHKAARELRRQWLTDSFMASRDSRLPRDVVLCDDEDDIQSLPWVPYVHFGV